MEKYETLLGFKPQSCLVRYPTDLPGLSEPPTMSYASLHPQCTPESLGLHADTVIRDLTH